MILTGPSRAKGLLSSRVAIVAATTVVAALPNAAARAQAIQQVIQSNAGSESLSFSPSAPAANLNPNDPVVNAAYFKSDGAATNIISTGGRVIASFASASGSQAVTVNIPSLGVRQTFTGGINRASNYAQALLFAEKQSGNLFVATAMASSPTSTSNPAVGTPLSLVPQMVNRTFRVDSGIGQFDPSLPPTAGLTRTPSALTAGGEITYGSAAGTDVLAITLPIDYKFYFSDPRYSITVDVPLTFLRVGSATVGLGSAGATFKFPVAANWSLGVGARAGAVGSEALRVGATAYSATLSSDYKLYLGDFKLTIGNSVSYLKTSGFRVGGGDSGPSLTNVPFSNGLSLEGALPFTLFAKPASYEAYVVDTYFAGQAIAIRHYDEIGLNLGTRATGSDQSWNNARLGVAYTVGRSFQAGSLRFSYRF